MKCWVNYRAVHHYLIFMNKVNYYQKVLHQALIVQVNVEMGLDEQSRLQKENHI